MNDQQIVALFEARNETAIDETQRKYERYCRSIAMGILGNEEDVAECVNDTYLSLWNAIPPHKPECLRTFAGKLVRNHALKCYEKRTAEKRGGGMHPEAFDELSECLPDGGNRIADDAALRDVLERFLRSLPDLPRRVFLRRYWYMSSVRDIAADFGMGESRVKSLLFRTRKRLRQFLEKEGIQV